MSDAAPAPEPIAARTLVLERILDATPDKVFAAWTTPELLLKWFTPKPYETVKVDQDLRPGGRANITMRSPEGVEMPNPGIYLEIVPNKKLVFTDAMLEGWEPVGGMPFMVATITFEDAPGGKTKYTATAKHFSIASTKQHEAMGFHAGWGAAADQLNELVKTL
ncbi:hypothetical protein sos41_18510 [Alphaproteobacteria bacterium SO-S41]|nr:hypothetical protein sos41_18510 [Alphaproteobacteria bacterium SO-S41]